MSRLNWLLAIIMLSLVWPISAAADAKVRMYKLNKRDQQLRIGLGNAAEKVGCQNLRRGKKVHRFAQAGFAWCQLYTQEDCAQESIVSTMWAGRKYRKYGIDGTKPQTKLYPGSQWLVQLDDEAIQSWYCEAE